jgi:hypothetical protein
MPIFEIPAGKLFCEMKKFFFELILGNKICSEIGKFVKMKKVKIKKRQSDFTRDFVHESC